VYHTSTAVEGVWRSAPIAGPKPFEPFRVSKVLVEVYKFRSAADGGNGDQASGSAWGGNCSVKCRVRGEWTTEVSNGNLSTPASTEQTWTQDSDDIPKDWQREVLEFNVNDGPPMHRCVIELKITMVAVRRVILYADHTGA
jgi:hypothetical protein